MARKLEEILKAKGYTEEELVALKPMLENAKFRETLEAEFANAEYFAEVGRKDAAEALRWREEEAIPQINKALESERKARAELAAKNEQLKTLQEQGLLKLEEQQAPKVDEKPVYVTEEQVKSHYKSFAEVEGAAIAAVQDLFAEYQDLFGKSIYSYISPSGKRGMEALREEAQAARATSLREFVSNKFKFDERRAELAAKASADHDAKIRADERAKVIAENVNPMLRAPRASIAPLITAKDKDGKMPWDNPEDRRSARVEKVAQKVLAGTI